MGEGGAGEIAEAIAKMTMTNDVDDGKDESQLLRREKTFIRRLKK
jgi:hypothetical protein